jgi:hypothetical protein
MQGGCEDGIGGEMTKVAFDKIKAGLDDAKAYLDRRQRERSSGMVLRIVEEEPEAVTRPLAKPLEHSRGSHLNDYAALRDYLKQQTLPEFVLSFDRIEQIIDAALPRAAHRASWWETLRSPQEKMPQREACLAAGYIATRLADGRNVRFKRMK